VDFADQISVIDTDTHVIEPYDLWTSRISVDKWGDKVPHVQWDPVSSEDAWFTGGQRLHYAAGSAMAGYPEYPPDHPRTMSDAHPSTYDVEERLKAMDLAGVHAQVLYPNVAGFGTGRFSSTMSEPELMLLCVQAYNDFLTDWTATDPTRFAPIMALPFWDIEASLSEIRRCASKGHKGIIFSGQPEAWGEPMLPDPHWDRIWAQAQEMGLPINFHIAGGDQSAFEGYPGNGRHANFARAAVLFWLGNGRTLTDLIVGGVCHRFPRLRFVSVESGIGWIPFLLQALDWQWKNCGIASEHPEYELLPSEYFKRQMYGCFWFEEGETLLTAIEALGADRVLYETDFPHPTSMWPGLAGGSMHARDFIQKKLVPIVPEDQLRLVLHDNAAALYGV
jgi:predicted TIM-barrel fold metal-dependent hydrolase